eukprot:1481210-Prymnesium_polylepis.1
MQLRHRQQPVQSSVACGRGACVPTRYEGGGGRGNDLRACGCEEDGGACPIDELVPVLVGRDGVRWKAREGRWRRRRRGRVAERSGGASGLIAPGGIRP